MCKVVDKQCIAMWGRELSDRISSVSCPAIAPKLLFHMFHMKKYIMLVVYISRNQAANRQKRLTATSQSFLIKNDNLENILCKLASWGWHDSWEGARLFSRSQHGNVHKCSSMVCNYTNAQLLLFTGGVPVPMSYSGLGKARAILFVEWKKLESKKLPTSISILPQGGLLFHFVQWGSILDQNQKIIRRETF